MKVKLGDIAVLINGDRGKNYPSQGDILPNGLIPFVNAGHLDGKDINFNAMKYISQEKYDQLKTGKFIKGDILYCLRGSLGKKAAIRNSLSGAIASSLVIIRPNSEKVDLEYLMYALDSSDIKEQLARANNGSSQPNLSAASVKAYNIDLPDKESQKKIAMHLTKVDMIINEYKQELEKLEEIIKSRFVEMFGDPIINNKKLPVEKMNDRYYLKAGITTPANNIHGYMKGQYEIPCYGGNGIRGYVEEKSYKGCYPIIGRQGALCGNVQYASGEFHATEHAVLVSLLKNDNVIWTYYMLKMMDLYRYHTGAAQPGLAVKTLNTIEIIVADINLQNQFAAFVDQINKSKLTFTTPLNSPLPTTSQEKKQRNQRKSLKTKGEFYG